jgi:anti-anti-sigma regulatory factor
VAEVLREGARSIRLNMKEVEYVSSAGIRVLFQTYKQLKDFHGTFAVSEPSEAVRSVLELAGLAGLLFEKASAGDVQVATPIQAETFVRGNARFEILESRPSKMTARVSSPELLVGCQFHQEHCQELPFGTASRLFELENLQGVLHLLNDERESGAGQSEFLRGACWIGSIAKISVEK